MSRVIKFRAWNTKHKYMDDTVFIRTCDGAAFDVPSVRCDTPNAEIELSNELVIMQFTGLSDVNGVEIYEGDILEKTYLKDENYDSGEYVRSDIVFHEQSFCERFTHDNGKVYYGKINRDSFVVGNIHQNPELLK